MKKLITGHRGYLAGNIRKHIPGEYIEFYGDVREYKKYTNIETIYHFAGPSDVYDFKDERKTVTTILGGSINMLRLAKENNCRLVFASTMGVLTEAEHNIYTMCKLTIERLIQSTCCDYLILRIPRVYSKCRNKGLMKQLRLGHVPVSDMQRIIDYLPLDTFIRQTSEVIDRNNGIHEYDVMDSKSIHDIYNWITEDNIL